MEGKLSISCSKPEGSGGATGQNSGTVASAAVKDEENG